MLRFSAARQTGAPCVPVLSDRRTPASVCRPLAQFSSKRFALLEVSTTRNFHSTVQVLTSRRGQQRSARRTSVISNVFERFSEASIKAVMLSQLEAKAYSAPDVDQQVGTEHVLLGLVMENATAAAKHERHTSRGVLGLTTEATQAALADMCGHRRRSSRGPRTPELPFSRNAKRAFEAAVAAAQRMNTDIVTPDHLAIALLSVGDVGASRLISRLGLDADAVKTAALQRLHRFKAAQQQPQPPLAQPQPQAQPAEDVAKPASAASSRQPKKRGSGSRQAGQALAEFCRDLCAEALAGRLDPVIGREAEVAAVVRCLGRRRKSNPLLLGEPGVGKSAIAESIASAITAGSLQGAPLPPYLVGQRVMSLDVGLLIAGAKERGELESRITSLLADAAAAGNVIFMIDEVHVLVHGGQTSRGAGAGLDIANLLKPPLARGEMRCIAATTYDDYMKYMQQDPALERRFQPITVREPTPAAARSILEGLRERYERHHKCVFEPEALDAAVELSVRYIPDRQLPDKAIDLMDEAGSRARIKAYLDRAAVDDSSRPGCVGPWKELQDVVAAKNEAAQDVRFEEAALLRARQVELVETLTAAVESGPRLPRVGAADVAAIVSLQTGIPAGRIAAGDATRLRHLPEALAGKVVGQQEAVEAAARAIQRAGAGMRPPNRPVASLLFCGPTGVGKTHLAKTLAEQYYGGEDAIIRLDMSEYMERSSVSKLIGAAPGFIGYGQDEAQLTEAVRRRPHSLLLLDEIEKAHPDVLNMLLQILEDGRLTDSKGRTVSFRETLVVMTSNVGSPALLNGGGSLGFQLDAGAAADAAYTSIHTLVSAELKEFFRPEFLNRLDEVVCFRPLDQLAVRSVAGLMVAETAQRLSAKGIRLEVAPALVDHICVVGFDQAWGVRPLRRAVTAILEDALADAMLRGSLQPGDSVLAKLSSALAAAAAAGRAAPEGAAAVALRIWRGGRATDGISGSSPRVMSNVSATGGLLRQGVDASVSA